MLNRKIQITIAVVIITIAIVVIGFYSIPSEKQKLSYSRDATIERNNSGESVTILGCEKSYPDLCIPKGNTELSCNEMLEKSFVVKHDDPNNFDPDKNGIGCE